MPAVGATGAVNPTIPWRRDERSPPEPNRIHSAAIRRSPKPEADYLAADAALAGIVGSAIMEVGAEDEPMVPVAVSGIGVVTDGAVLAGVAGSTMVSTFLPQAPSASRAQSATTVVTERAANGLLSIGEFLEKKVEIRRKTCELSLGERSGKPPEQFNLSHHRLDTVILPEGTQRRQRAFDVVGRCPPGAAPVALSFLPPPTARARVPVN